MLHSTTPSFMPFWHLLFNFKAQATILYIIQHNYSINNPLGNLNPLGAARERSSLEAPHCSSYSMRLSLNYFGVLFLVASICQFVFFYDKVEVTRTIRMRCNVTKCISTVARWR